MEDRGEQIGQTLIKLRDLPQESSDYEAAKTELLRLLTGLVRVCQDDRLNWQRVTENTEKSLFQALTRAYLKNLKLETTAASDLHSSLVRLYNKILKWRELDEYRRLPKVKVISLDAPISTSQGEEVNQQLPDPAPTGFELIRNNIGSQVWDYLEKDPDGKLRDCYPRERIDPKGGRNEENMRSRPDANCHILAQRLLLKEPPDKLAVIARDLNINYNTLRDHWQGKCLPLLQEIAAQFLQEIAYQFDYMEP